MSDGLMIQEPVDVEDRIHDANGNEFLLPDYTISQVRAAIPRHCYDRSAGRSLAYVARDMISILVAMLAFETIGRNMIARWPNFQSLMSLVYIVLQSLHMTGLWVLGHECGHQAFSACTTLNDTVGYILHSSILVPYFSWKISHGKHHKATNNMDRDMGFVPETIEQHHKRTSYFSSTLDSVEETPIYAACSLFKLQAFGWWAYLLTNTTSHNQHEGQREGRGIGKKDGFWTGVNHFNISSPIFDNKHTKDIVISNLGLVATLSMLSVFGHTYGWGLLALHYLLPYLLLNNWIVLITSMQHSDPSVPYYRSKSWNWTRGCAATIDRDLGFIGRYFFHSIVDTHVLHHHVSTIPFYNAAEASNAIKGVLGRHYRSDTNGGLVGFFRAVWRRTRYCQWVEPTSSKGQGEAVLFYRSHTRLKSRKI